MTTAPPSPARPVPLWARLGRLAAIGVVLLAAGYAARLYVHLARGPAAVTSPPPSEIDIPAAALAAVPPGPWSLGDQPWDLRSQAMAKEEALAWLEGPAPPAAARPANSLEGSLLRLIRARGQRRVGAGGAIVYAFDRKALRVRALCRREGGGERMLAARALFPEGRAWRALELRPAEGAAASVAGGRLLPWPVGTEALAVRRDEGGAPLAEMARAPRARGALLTGLRSAGWSVTGEEPLTCRGPGGEAVQAWVTSDTSSETVILAVRLREKQP